MAKSSLPSTVRILKRRYPEVLGRPFTKRTIDPTASTPPIVEMSNASMRSGSLCRPSAVRTSRSRVAETDLTGGSSFSDALLLASPTSRAPSPLRGEWILTRLPARSARYASMMPASGS